MIYPATSPHVVGVGGTTLNTASNSRGWTESVWKTSTTEGTGSGCSAFEPRPSWQSSISLITAACSHRVDNDVAADADPSTGAAVYDTTNGNGGWNEVGGTSESSPMIAAVFALAGNNGNGGNNAAANRTRQNKVVYLNRNFILASGIPSILHPNDPDCQRARL